MACSRSKIVQTLNLGMEALRGSGDCVSVEGLASPCKVNISGKVITRYLGKRALSYSGWGERTTHFGKEDLVAYRIPQNDRSFC